MSPVEGYSWEGEYAGDDAEDAVEDVQLAEDGGEDVVGGGGEHLVGQGGPGTPGRDEQVSHRQVHQVVVDCRPVQWKKELWRRDKLKENQTEGFFIGTDSSPLPQSANTARMSTSLASLLQQFSSCVDGSCLPIVADGREQMIHPAEW